MLDRGFDEQLVEDVISTLQQQRLLSDSRAAEATARMRSGQKAVGRDMLKEELLRKGGDEVHLELADRTDEQERDLMVNLILKFDNRERAGRLLARRGFSEELIESVLNQHFGEPD